MNFHNPAQTYSRSMTNTRFWYQARRQKVFTWSSDKILFQAVGKVLLVLVPVVLAVNLWLASCSSHLIVSIQEVDNVNRTLVDKEIKLKAKRALLYSPEQVRLLAAEKLSLHVPDTDQVKYF